MLTRSGSRRPCSNITADETPRAPTLCGAVDCGAGPTDLEVAMCRAGTAGRPRGDEQAERRPIFPDCAGRAGLVVLQGAFCGLAGIFSVADLPELGPVDPVGRDGILNVHDASGYQ